MGLLPRFARPEANRHHRQIASSGPAWGQRTDILIVVIGMVLTARFVAPFFIYFFFFVPFFSTYQYLLYLVCHRSFLCCLFSCCFYILPGLFPFGCIRLTVSHSGLILSKNFPYGRASGPSVTNGPQAGNITHLPFPPCISISSPPLISNSLTLLKIDSSYW